MLALHLPATPARARPDLAAEKPQLPPPQRPPHPAPTQAAGAPGVPRAQIPGLPREWLLGARAVAWGGPSRPSLSPPSRPAGSGDSPPPETAEKLGRDAGPDHSQPPRRPPAGRPSELPTPRGYLPRARPARERGPRGGARGEPLPKALRRRSPAAAPSAPPGHGPFLGHGRTGFAAWAPLAGPAGDWLSRPPRPSLRLRRLRAGSRGAPRAARITAGSADWRRRLLSTEAGRAGARAPRSCPRRGRPDRRRPCFCSLFFFFPSPPSVPFHRTALSYPPPSPFPTAGAGGRARGRGGAGRMRGRGAAEPRPPGGRARGPRSAPRPPGPPRVRGADPPSQPAGPGSASELPSEQKQRGRKDPGRSPAPLPAGPRLTVRRGLLPWPRAGGGGGGSSGKGTPRRSESPRSVRGRMPVPGPGAPFLPSQGGSWNFHSWLWAAETREGPADWRSRRSLPGRSAPGESWAALGAAAAAEISEWEPRMWKWLP